MLKEFLSRLLSHSSFQSIRSAKDQHNKHTKYYIKSYSDKRTINSSARGTYFTQTMPHILSQNSMHRRRSSMPTSSQARCSTHPARSSSTGSVRLCFFGSTNAGSDSLISLKLSQWFNLSLKLHSQRPQSCGQHKQCSTEPSPVFTSGMTTPTCATTPSQSRRNSLDIDMSYAREVHSSRRNWQLLDMAHVGNDSAQVSSTRLPRHDSWGQFVDVAEAEEEIVQHSRILSSARNKALASTTC